MSEPTSDELFERPAGPRPMSPSAARRRLGHELRTLRDTVGLRLEDAGRHVQRSPATMSRLESGKTQARMIEVAALLDFYAARNPQAVPPDVRERMLRLAADSRSSQWFDPFRDVLTGSMTPDHHKTYVEYESDANEIRNFEPELIPGLLQTHAYALAVADIFFPGHPRGQRTRFAEFRVARQRVLNSHSSPLRLNAAIGESALWRSFGDPSVRQTQIQAIRDEITGGRPNVFVNIVPISAAVPAAFGGPFVVMSFDSDDEDDLVYLETRSGGDYMEDAQATDRFQLYFDSLLEVSLPRDEAVNLIDRVLDDLG